MLGACRAYCSQGASTRAFTAGDGGNGHRRFAGVAMLAYFGLGRIGEVLRTRRSDLLLPQEDLCEQGGAAFLRLGASKTSTRGQAYST